jgi:hypothetical protein
MTWSVVDYMEALVTMGTCCLEMNEQVERRLYQLFPPGTMEMIAQPCVVVDSEGMILLWFLPGLLHRKRQVGGSL